MYKKKINIVAYDSNWVNIFKIHADELKNKLKENCVEVYHVGSTSVPELCAKPIVDMMCVVKDLNIASKKLSELGYKCKGEFNLPLRLFFQRKTPNDVHIHVVKENSGEIAWNLVFQDYLRKNEEAREMYAKTKLDLIKENPDGFKIIPGLFSEYTIKKGECIKKIAKRAGFSDYRFVIVANYDEISEYKKLMNVREINFDDENMYHLCLYKGVEIIAAACVKFDASNSIATIISIASANDKDEYLLKDKIKEWVKFHNLSLAK